MISVFESFMNDLVRMIIDNYPNLIKWPEKKQISFDPNILDYYSPTLGELIIKSSLREKFNFQDLQSTLKFLEEYLSVKLNLREEVTNNIIKYQALRHTIVHNFSTIDDKFMKQVRNIKNNYKIGDNVKLNENDYSEAKKSFDDLVKEIIDKVKEKY